MRGLLAALARVSPEIAARAAVRLFRTVRHHRMPPREVEWVEQATRVEIETHGRTLRGLAWGEGPTVLMMHGWEGRASQMGSVGLALADVGLRAVSLEAPGHGGEEPRISSLWEFADALTGFVDREGPLAGFVGHSFGVAGACYAAQRGTLAFDRSVGRAVFIAPPGDLHDFFEILFGLLRLRPEVRQRFVELMEAGLEAPWSRVRLCTQLASAEIPLLILHDERDAETPIDGAEAVAAAWPRSRLRRSIGLGHRRILRDADTLRAAAAFLTDA